MEDKQVVKVLTGLSKLSQKVSVTPGRDPGSDFIEGYQAALQDVADALSVDLTAPWAGHGFTKQNDESAGVAPTSSV